MNTKFFVSITSSLIALGATLAHAEPFSYQGSLEFEGAPANGLFDLQFELHENDGSSTGSVLSFDDVIVEEGVFTVMLDFEDDAFQNESGQALLISVREGDSAGSFTDLLPFVHLGAVPVAQYALNEEIDRVGTDLYLGDKVERLLINPVVTDSSFLNIATKMQLNFTESSYGGMYIHGESTNSLPFLGFARNHTIISYLSMEKNENTNEDELKLTIGANTPLIARGNEVQVDATLVVNEDLYVDEDITSTGEIRKEYPNSIETVSPLAFGYVSTSGVGGSGSENYSVHWNNGINRYEITITDVNYRFDTHTCVITPISIGFTAVTTSSASGKLNVHAFNLNGNRVQTAFHFMVMKND